MSDLTTNPVSTTQASSTDSSLPVTDTNTQAAGGASSTVNASTPIKSLDDLKTKSPKLYDMMMQGIAMNICNDMKDRQERLKELMREGRT